MIDFQKTEVFSLAPGVWLENDLLEFRVLTSVKTGKERSKRVARYNGLDFIIVQTGRMFIHGSLHKYFNFMKGVKAPSQKTNEEVAKGFNGNPYTYLNFVETLMDIEERFNISFENSRLTNLEVGINFQHDLDASAFLCSLIMLDGKLFNKPLHNSYREVQKAQYYMKVYDKTLQYGMSEKVLRYELKFVKMFELNKRGVLNLQSLLDQSVLSKLKALLLRQWERVHLFDHTINVHHLEGVEKERALLYSNQNYWSRLEPRRRHRPRKYYKEIETCHSDQIGAKVYGLINSTWDSLMCTI